MKGAAAGPLRGNTNVVSQGHEAGKPRSQSLSQEGGGKLQGSSQENNARQGLQVSPKYLSISDMHFGRCSCASD